MKSKAPDPIFDGLMSTLSGRRCYAVAGVSLEIGEIIARAMKRQKMSHSKVARRTKITTERLHEILGGDDSVSLKILSDVFFALGMRMVVTGDKNFRHGNGPVRGKG